MKLEELENISLIHRKFGSGELDELEQLENISELINADSLRYERILDMEDEVNEL